jgi:flagellar biosynthetic protein FliR
MDILISKLLAFFLVLARISGFFLTTPFFSWGMIPARVKVGIAVLLSFFFAMINSPGIDPDNTGMLEAGLLLANELIYGAGLGFIFVLVFSAVKVSGRIIERQMGLALARTFDPLSGERGRPIGLLLQMILILLFFAADGHHLLIMIISRSYESFPAGTIPEIEAIVEGVTNAGSTMLAAGLRLCAPILAAFLLLLIVLGVLARVMPDMNILFISMPLRVGMGLLMLSVFLPFIKGFVSEFAGWMGKLLPL